MLSNLLGKTFERIQGSIVMEGLLPGLRRTGINLLSIWGQRVVGILVTLIVIPIITHHFGLELVGIWLQISTGSVARQKAG